MNEVQEMKSKRDILANAIPNIEKSFDYSSRAGTRAIIDTLEEAEMLEDFIADLIVKMQSQMIARTLISFTFGIIVASIVWKFVI